MKYVASQSKDYLVTGPFELQYGHTSQDLLVFWRPRWRRLITIPTKPFRQWLGINLIAIGMYVFNGRNGTWRWRTFKDGVELDHGEL